MDRLRFAAAMEASIRQSLEYMMQNLPVELTQLVNLAVNFQVKFELLLDQAQHTDIDNGKYPEINLEKILGSDDQWQQAIKKLAAQPADKTQTNLIYLWQMYALAERSSHFYYQAISNTPHPSTRLFINSLAEIKNVLKRRLDSAVRVIHNQIWAQVGFAPFALGKD